MPVDFDSECSYLNADLSAHQIVAQYISNLKIYCRRIILFIDFYIKQITSYNCTAHETLTKEIALILLNFLEDRKDKGSIIASLITGFIGLAYEGVPSYLHPIDK